MSAITLLKSRFFSLGGAEKQTRLLADAFAKRGCTLTILTTETGNTPYNLVVHPLQKRTSFGKVREFDRFCKNYCLNHIDPIIFGFDRNSYQTHLRAGSGVHRAYLHHRKQIESRGKQLRHLLNPLHRLILHIEKTGFENPALQKLFVNSHLVKNEILTYYNVPEEKIVVIHNGVEWSSQFELNNRGPESQFQFLFIGNNFERKGLEGLLKGLARLKMREFALSVVGTDKKETDYKKLAKELGLEKQVSFHGVQQQISPFLQKADCLVIPSLYDPFANVTVEALAMGLFVVSSKTNGGSEVLKPFSGCVIEELFNEEAMESALTTALRHPKTKESAEEIRASIAHLTISKQLDRYVQETLC